MELFLKMKWEVVPLEWLQESKAELVCSVRFAGLPVVRRVFV